MTRVRWALAAVVVLALAWLGVRFLPIQRNHPQPSTSRVEPAPPPVVRRWEDVDRDIAARFAPTFYQGVIGSERFDYITNFDFDGDWRGENNWEHAADTHYPQKAYVYYAVSETPTHYFVHYAAFHPRDWKGGEKTGRFLSSTIHGGVTVGGTIKARGMMDDLVLSHENDLEGCLVVAVKHGPTLEAARVVLVETMAHNQYLRFAIEPRSSAVAPLRLDDQHPLLYVEAQGHGIEAFHDQPVSAADASGEGAADQDSPSENDNPPPKKSRFGRIKSVGKVKGLVTSHLRIEGMPTNLLVYRFSGTADDPDAIADGPIGYDLQPLYTTFWKVASEGDNATYGETIDYGTRTITVVVPGQGNVPVIESRQVKLGSLGSALRGVVGARNKARPPWAWFDRGERHRPLGEWFFDPAVTVGRHLAAASAEWATAYLHDPFLGVIRSQTTVMAPGAPALLPVTIPVR